MPLSTAFVTFHQASSAWHFQVRESLLVVFQNTSWFVAEITVSGFVTARRCSVTTMIPFFLNNRWGVRVLLGLRWFLVSSFRALPAADFVVLRCRHSCSLSFLPFWAAAQWWGRGSLSYSFSLFWAYCLKNPSETFDIFHLRLCVLLFFIALSVVSGQGRVVINTVAGS